VPGAVDRQGRSRLWGNRSVGRGDADVGARRVRAGRGGPEPVLAQLAAPITRVSFAFFCQAGVEGAVATVVAKKPCLTPPRRARCGPRDEVRCLPTGCGAFGRWEGADNVDRLGSPGSHVVAQARGIDLLDPPLTFVIFDRSQISDAGALLYLLRHFGIPHAFRPTVTTQRSAANLTRHSSQIQIQEQVIRPVSAGRSGAAGVPCVQHAG
jgi:hypothetical protein